nr:Beta-ketoacyl synthase [uncultured bacterium]
MKPHDDRGHAERLARALTALERMQHKLDAAERAASEPIAIVGMGCRFPGGADTPEKFWELLREGRDATSEIPAERWSQAAVYDPNPDAPGKIYTRRGAFLEDVAGFDPQFFGISPREAERLDPQQRLLLEVTWEALENAGMVPERAREARGGVFVGIGQNDYGLKQFYSGDHDSIDIYDGSGNGFSFASGRLSYVLGLSGPSMSIDTACSSALVATHLATKSLRQRECDFAIVGGVQLVLSPDVYVFLCRAKALSPSGKSRSFDAAADGYARGEGCGVVILKRLSDAQAAGDRIIAVIRGTATNHDGPSSGLTVPSAPAQARVIRAALDDGRVAAGDVDYVEAHGTGTRLGDPIEAQALGAVFAAAREREPLLIGSVKTNVGHLEAGAGIVGLIKVALALEHKAIPASLHFSEPNPLIAWDDLRLRVATSLLPWPARNGRRAAGVSAWGLSGSNAHVVVQEYAGEPAASHAAADARPVHVLTLGSPSAKGLAASAERFKTFLQRDDQASFADVCFSANTGRGRFARRLAIVARNRAEAVEKLSAPFIGEARGTPGVAFLFTGQGSQYPGMGRELYEGEPRFRRTLDRCAEILAGDLAAPLLDVLYPPATGDARLHDTAFTQPALFALEYSLAELWRAWGVKPDVVLGHSLGEYVAACVAGCFSLEDGLKLVTARSRLMQALPRRGAMVSAQASEARVAARLRPYAATVSIAAVNGPESVVFSGTREHVHAVQAALEKDGVHCVELQVSHAFHSPLMEPVLREFEAVVRQVTLRAPDVALISNLTGEVAGSELTTPEYWVKHVREAVRFHASVLTLDRVNCRTLLEIGPDATLLALARRCAPDADVESLPSLRRARPDWEQILESAARLYVRGVPVDWQAVDEGRDRRRVTLPNSAFERRRYWIESRRGKQTQAETDQIEAAAIYKPVWREQPLAVSTAAAPTSWVIFAEVPAMAEQLAAHLRAGGAACAVVDAADAEAAARSMAAVTERPDGLVYLCATEKQSHDFGLDRCARFLSVAQARARTTRWQNAALWLVTSGTSGLDASLNLEQTAVAGLARTVALESSHTGDGHVDLPLAPDARVFQALASELRQPTIDRRVAFAAGKRFVSKLIASEPATASAPQIHAGGTYLVTGGSGGLGLEVARWLAEQGCRHLALMNRSGTATPAAREAVADLERRGVSVTVLPGDVAHEEAVQRVLSAVRATRYPLRGIIHAAGVIDDATVEGLDEERLRTVFAPKVRGAWHLHQLSQPDRIDFFVMFSSGAALLGSPGQGNYAAANAFLDGLAEMRRRQGRPALSINWGPWAEVGMAAGHHAAKQARFGMKGISTAAGLNALGVAMTQDAAHVGVLPADWDALAAAFPKSALSAFVSELCAATATDNVAVAGEQRPTLAATLHSSPVRDRNAVVLEVLEAEVRRVLSLAPGDEVDPVQGFFDMGMDSLTAVEFLRALRRRVGRELPSTLVYDHPTLEQLAPRVLDLALTVAAERAPVVAAPPVVASLPEPTPPALVATPEVESIAILGMGCRFPGGANNAESCWRVLRDGVDAVGKVPAARQSHVFENDAAALQATAMQAALLDGVDGFDAGFFGIAAREAAMVDPQQRLLLEVAWEALEDAGLAPASLAGTRTGVFMGISQQDYLELIRKHGDKDAHDIYMATGNGLCFASGRLSYLLGLRGPSLSLDTACSSSLVALHLACESLKNRECDTAIVGGVQLIFSPSAFTMIGTSGALAADGRCKTFDASADGYGRGEGCGVIVLKRMADARSGGDRILAAIRGSAINHDGRSSGLTVPSRPAQEELLRAALDDAGLAPSDVGYVEAHGTGTPMGDPIEVAALGSVYGDGRTRETPLLVGTVKSNFGHLEAAAGMAGLVKVILSLRHGVLPPSLHFNEPNPAVPWDELPIQVVDELRPWPAWDQRRVAGLSAFSLSGANAHVIVESVNEPARASSARKAKPGPQEQMLTLSARTDTALRALAARYRDRLAAGDPLGLEVTTWADVCFTAAVGRSHFRHRLALVAESLDEARRQLTSYLAGKSVPGLSDGVAGLKPPRVEADVTSLSRAELAQLYVRGASIDWIAVYRDRDGRKIALPTYPFERQRHWFTATTDVTLTAVRNVSRIGVSQMPLVGDHRLFGDVVVAGATHLALVIDAAANAFAGDGTVVLQDVAFPQALVLADSEERAFEITITPEADRRASFQVSTGVTHATGSVSLDARGEERVALADMLRRFEPRRDPAEYFAELEARGVGLGAQFRWIEALWTGQGEAFARIRPAVAADQIERFRLHPGIIDSFVQLLGAAVMTQRDRDTTLIPTRIESFRVHARATGRPLWCHVQIEGGSTHSSDLRGRVRLIDDEGALVAEATRVEMRAASAQKLRATRESHVDVYEPAWVEQQRAPEQDSTPRHWIVCAAADDSLAPVLAGELEARGHSCEIAISIHQVVERVAAAADGRGLGIAYLAADDEHGDAALADAFHLSQALVRNQCPVAPLTCFVTRGTRAVGASSPPPRVQGGSLWGLLQALSVEVPSLQTRRIDVTEACDAEEMKQLAAELTAAADDEQIALRGVRRYVAKLARGAAVGSNHRLDLDPHATYLITGGLGALGLHVARRFAERGARQLALCSRRGITDESQAAVAELEERGVRVLVFRADVAQPADVAAILSVIKESGAPLKGIVHAAGVVDDAAISDLNWPRVQSVLAPKVSGAWNLHEATQDQPLQFFVLFSSVASLIGAYGQSSYAAGNAYLDALAQHRHARGLPALSVNWGPWGGAGLAANLPPAQRARIADRGIGTLDPEIALDALETLLARNIAQAAVVDIDWARLSRHVTRPGSIAFLADLLPTREQEAGVPALSSHLRQASSEELPAMVAQEVRRVAATVMRTRVTDVELDRGFTEMGMDSVMALEFVAQLKAMVDCELPSTLIYKYPTPVDLAEFLITRIAASPAQQKTDSSAPASPANQDDVARLLEEEIAALEGRTS